VEGHGLFHESVDVVVCDGFVGNIVLKTCESLAMAIFSMLKHELKANAQKTVGSFTGTERISRRLRSVWTPSVTEGLRYWDSTARYLRLTALLVNAQLPAPSGLLVRASNTR
jgi:hypothetical protein